MPLRNCLFTWLAVNDIYEAFNSFFIKFYALWAHCIFQSKVYELLFSNIYLPPNDVFPLLCNINLNILVLITYLLSSLNIFCTISYPLINILNHLLNSFKFSIKWKHITIIPVYEDKDKKMMLFIICLLVLTPFSGKALKSSVTKYSSFHFLLNIFESSDQLFLIALFQ